MTLTLLIRNQARLDNGMPTEFVLHRRGAVIGRSPTCDWSLPDARNYISSRHCEINFDNGSYTLTDVSTNGTYLNGAQERMVAQRVLRPGDVIQIGQYEVVVSLSDEATASIERGDAASAARRDGDWGGWEASAGVAPPPPPPPEATPSGWASPPVPGSGWDSAPASGWGVPAASPAPPPSEGWGAPPAAAPPSGDGWAPPPAAERWASPTPAPAAPMTGQAGWSPSMRAPDPPAASVWSPPPPPAEPASAWSSAAPDRPRDPAPDDVWGKIAEGNVVDWARGGFGQPIAAPPPLPATAAEANWSDAPGAAAWAAARPPVEPRQPTLPPGAAMPAAAATPPANAASDVAALARGAGLPPDKLAADPALVERAGALMRRLVAGLVLMVEARARAKSQMGADATGFEFDGNNPIKFARTPEEAVASLLNPPQRGFMPAERAIEDAFLDLQSHQMATLKAMQGALKSTLDRFSPNAIKGRAEAKGLLQRILPGGRDAALWAAYEREFGGVAQGSDEAFMEVFAREFRKAYEEQSRQAKARR
ncbi:type VI secretion system-associated FHA domain protein TagH [Sphingomonas sp. Y38-1Y]|uniref:type VI secretion system-associated FHA domain protein TagH n=1 Tax=Sphingomonas sp. Y38-1Y TaxID=3078265 RepID=UPI0028E7FDA6|nr:type VI secretion system-associated FHA domain protein TagH [Sphingomonas sp. Y38-1Y]